MLRSRRAGSVQQFPYRLRDLKKATNNFSDKNKLGSGGSADVYKGKINETIVAIKKLHGNSVKLQVDVDKEAHMLRSLEHENIVKLLGFCSGAGQYLLVYEYVQNGNLATYLDDESKLEELNWGMRFNIINGIARGLFYLHHDLEDSIIHRDLKPENVLLDENHNAKIADFGLSKILDKNKTHSTTRNGSGTPGYLAPEFLYFQHYSPKSDIYNFGLLIIEIIVGCTIRQYSKRNSQILPHVVWHQWKNNSPLIHITNMSVREELSQDQIKRCILIGLLCIQNDHNNRPSMKDVLQMFNTNISLSVPGLPGFFREETSKMSFSSISSSSLESALALSLPSYNKETDTLPTPQTEGEILSSPNLMAFSLNDLKIATRNFWISNLIYEGEFGNVYKGWLDEQTLTPVKPGSGMVVVVKRFEPGKEWQFVTELDYVGRLHHPNLIKLIGHCSEGDNRLLVYEFMPRGSLHYHLFRSVKTLSWKIRLKVAIGAAKALSFLHAKAVSFLHDAESGVVHRSFETADIHLDSDYNAKLVDFCVAKVRSRYVRTMRLGQSRIWHVAPEYMVTGHHSSKVDVYSFGLFLLELLTGRQVIRSIEGDLKYNLFDWAKPCLGNRLKLDQIMDSRLEGRYPKKKALVVSNLALLCTSYEPEWRPNMSEVLEKLEHLQDPK
ncbi:hypothetical protein LUZ63_018539 [Rhynchospora breviuscula]|uniref:non-specific serine/threonine protein kinase n=1 Tax=Rhynchospora breviuscula TaxID=2022672 RepID=A0A9Q0HI76_9POAL|nr:hypothetical protein LUZ63_018539 [Rhynchospora breviuscula]